MSCYKNKEMKKSHAFTLAETLITLTIIGVIAAMTLPTLMHNYQAQKLKTAFWAANSIAKNTEGALNSDGVCLCDLFFDDFIPYFNHIGGETALTKESNKYYNFNGTQISTDSWTHKLHGAYTLKNGMTIWSSLTEYGLPKKPNSEETVDPYYGLVIDINGVKNRPNRYGHDVFFWYHDKDTGTISIYGTESIKSKMSPESLNCNPTSTSADSGVGCGAKALADPDYFKKLKN